MSISRILRLLVPMAWAACLPSLAQAQSYVIVDNQTGHILSSSDANKKRQIASITKVATAMVVIDWADVARGSLSTTVAVPPGAARIGGLNPCGLMPGDYASLRDLLYAALMQSDNIAAYTIAHHVGGKLPNPQRLAPVDNFVSQMNALGRKLGMKRTLFLNPTGLDSERAAPHSTASDVARLTRYAYAHPGFNFYVSQATREITIYGADGVQRSFLLRNTNELLGTDGIDGVKTGRTAKAGDCVVLSADRDPETRKIGEQMTVTPRRIIVVLLGSPNRFGQGLQLIRGGWSLYDQWAAQGRPTKPKTTL